MVLRSRDRSRVFRSEIDYQQLLQTRRATRDVTHLATHRPQYIIHVELDERVSHEGGVVRLEDTLEVLHFLPKKRAERRREKATGHSRFGEYRKKITRECHVALRAFQLPKRSLARARARNPPLAHRSRIAFR